MGAARARQLLDAVCSVVATHHQPVTPLAGRQEIVAFAQAMGWFTLDHLDGGWVAGPARDGSDLTHRKNHRKRVNLPGIRPVPIDETWGHGRLAYAWTSTGRGSGPVLTRHGLAVRSLAVPLAGGRVLPSGTGIYVVDGAVGGLRRRMGHLGIADVFPWPDIVAVVPERVGESSVRLDWTRAPMAAILVDSGHCPVELVDRVEALLPWWPLIAVITANRHLARSHPVFAGVTVIPAPRGRAGL